MKLTLLVIYRFMCDPSNSLVGGVCQGSMLSVG